MKIVFASTPGQDEEISKLVCSMYTDIFPRYFADEEIRYYEQLKVLSAAGDRWYSTLSDAFQVIASLQTVISILKLPVLTDHYSTIFNKNVEKLQNFGLFFPFDFDHFVKASSPQNCVFSVYTKATNEMLI